MELVQLFVHNYKRFKDFLKTEPLDAKNRPCMTLFGVPGAGKSTLLARLLSDISPDQFHEDVINRPNNKEIITVSDVDIGKSSTSVTMVPRLYTVGTMLIYDAPGFKDTDVNKNIVINILHKCLLNHINKNKFIVVMKVGLLDDERMVNLISDYHNSFKSLFGDNYRSCIDNIYFVLTHIDKSVKTMNEIPELITDRMIGAIDVNDTNLAFFVKRLSKYHIIIDYKSQTRQDILQAMSNMMNDGSKGMEQDHIIKTQLNTFENDLDKKLTETLYNLHITISKKYEQEKTKLEKLLEENKSFKNQINIDSDFITTKSKRLEEIQDFLKTVDGKINQLKSNIEKMRSEIKLYNQQSNDTDSLINTFDKIITNMEVINYRCDVSTKGVMTNNYTRLRIFLNPLYHKNKVILVLRYENDDITFKRYLGSDSLIPPSINVITDFRGTSLLYNNGAIIDNGFKVTKNNLTDNNILEFDAEYSSPFKVFIYTYTVAKNAGVDHKMKNKLENDKISFLDEVENLTLKITELEIEITSLSAKDQDRRNELLNIENEIRNLESNIQLNQQNIEKNKELIKNQLTLINNISISLNEDSMYKNSRTVEDIFKDNKIISSFSKNLQTLKEFDNTIINYSNTMKKNL